jgi:hypothetical protein
MVNEWKVGQLPASLVLTFDAGSSSVRYRELMLHFRKSSLHRGLCIEVSGEDGEHMLAVLRAERYRGLLLTVLHHGPIVDCTEYVAFVRTTITPQGMKNMMFHSGIACCVSETTAEMIQYVAQWPEG